MSELNENNQELIDIVTENQNKDDNEILGMLIGSGVLFNKAKGILDKILINQGLKLTKAQRDEKAEELMASFSITAETTSDEVEDQVEMLMDELNIKTGMARKYVKDAFEEASIEMPKAPKKSSGPRAAKVPGFRGDVKIAADYAIANPVATENDKEDFKAFMDERGGSMTKSGTDKSTRWHSAVEDLRIFAVAWKEAGNCS